MSYDKLVGVIACRNGRILKPELLDTLPAERGRANLQDLVRLNRRWGGLSTVRWLLSAAQVEGAFSLVDIGAASGDMGSAIRVSHPQAKVVSVDYIPWHLESAAHPKVGADGFALPFQNGAFDYSFCSLFLHHFTAEEIVRLLAEFRRVARRAVLVIDLERHFVPYYFVPWTRWLLGWDPITCHDAAISVEAAFLPAELEELARAAGLQSARARTFRPAFRIAMLARV
jgi:hypothetical protein